MRRIGVGLQFLIANPACFDVYDWNLEPQLNSTPIETQTNSLSEARNENLIIHKEMDSSFSFTGKMYFLNFLFPIYIAYEKNDAQKLR